MDVYRAGDQMVRGGDRGVGKGRDTRFFFFFFWVVSPF